MTKQQKRILFLLCLLFLTIAFLSPFIGQIKLSDIDWNTTINEIKNGRFYQTDFYLLMSLRLPRVLAAILTGGALALSGLVMQACIQNPLADPYLFGVSSGATLGATFAITILPFVSIPLGQLGITSLAFIGGVFTTFLILRLARHFQNQLTILILIGVVINAVCQSLTSLLIYRSASSDAVKSATYWTMGSLVGIGYKELSLLLTVLLIATFYFFKKSYILDLLLLGVEQGNTLGIDSLKYQKKMMIIVATVTSLFVSQTGIIGFVGLIVPHLSRKLVGNKHQVSIAATILLGSILLMIADMLARILVKNGELPIGVVTSLIGAPLFFLIIIDRYKIGDRRK